MKQKRLFILSLFCLFFVLSCRKSTECTGIILTVTVSDAGVETPLGGCTLVIGESDFADSIKRTVMTDASGRYEGTWLRQAYLPVVATKGDYRGVGYLDLTPGNVYELKIPMYK